MARQSQAVVLFSCDEPTCPKNQNKPYSGVHFWDSLHDPLSLLHFFAYLPFFLFLFFFLWQVKQTTATIGTSVTVSQVGSDLPSTTAPLTLSPLGGTKDWQPTVTVDEDVILNRWRSTLLILRSRDAPVGEFLCGLTFSCCSFACFCQYVY